ncbi:MAG: hypothetical protein PVJ72_19395, partial [Gammaproteobacteria bacterium]
RRQVSKPLAHNSPARSGVFLQRQQQPPQQQPQQQPPQQQPPQQQPPQQQPPQQQPAQPQQNVVLEVEMEVQHNIVDAQGNVVGVSGTQTLTYTDSNGNQIREVHNNVQWREDATVEAGQATPYEHPAAVERFSIVRGTGRYPISTTHSERGIAIHAPGRSEGCILANQGVRNDIQNRLNNNEQIQGEITNITDTRTPAEQQVAPLPQ